MQTARYWSVLLLVTAVACGDDESAGGDDAGEDMVVTGMTGGTGGAATGGTGGTTTMTTGGTGGSTTQPLPEDDAGTVDGGGSTNPPPTGLAMDGTRLAVCYDNSECTGDLECTQYSGGAGYCVETCANGNDKDCIDIDGVTTTCGSNGQCRIDCEGSGSGDGPCPTDMECINSGFNTYRCQYPEGTGANDKVAYEQCDPSGGRGDADCASGLSCALFAADLPLLSQMSTPYCVEECTEAGDCTDPGTGATRTCYKEGLPPLQSNTGKCTLDCDNDKDCPGDMLCQSVNLLGKRCGYAP